ncbi:porin family protein [Tellurirhabdus bombi]|uniref:porin family protein n=1 Tax=Tellurirhabdus bombi TaxID=2907205 RepID=UPI001F36B0CE|nr:porin family protein [Tellurirhabdus bombi]
MKTYFLTCCLLAASLLTQAQTAKPKTTAAKKPVAVAKKTTAAKPKTASAQPTATARPVAKASATQTAPAATSATASAQTEIAENRTTTPASAKTAAAPARSAAAKPTKVASPTNTGKGLSVGFRAGANVVLNKFTEDDQSAGVIKRVPGFTGGVVLNYGISNSFSIQPEILYTRRTIKASGSDAGITFSTQVDINSVEVPLLLKGSFGKQVRVFVNAGPYVNYNLNARLKITINGQSESEKQKFGKGDARLEYGVTGGAGVMLPVGPGSLMVEGRYTHALGTNSKEQSDVSEYFKLATVSIGYIIPLGL